MLDKREQRMFLQNLITLDHSQLLYIINNPNYSEWEKNHCKEELSKRNPLKVAVICEYSGTVRESFKSLGHDATSFDILPTEILGKHIQDDIMNIPLDYWKQFDLAICHPPCTDLAISGARHFKSKLEKNPNIQIDALNFVQYLMDLPIKKIAIENPVSIISTRIRKPDQIIQPWQFGEPFQKTTCLWLKNLPLLEYTKIVDKGSFITFPSGKKMPSWYSDKKGKDRSKTFEGIANAMANQWGGKIQCLSKH